MQGAVRKKRKRKKYVRAMVSMLLAMWTMLGSIGLFAIVYSVRGKIYESALAKTPNESEDKSMSSDENVNIGSEERWESKKEEWTKCKEIYENNLELLVLVNQDHELDVNYDPKLRTICNGRLEASDRMYKDLTRMLHAAGDEGYDYWIASAYRSRQRQQQLIDEDVDALMKKGWSYDDALRQTLQETMPAGYSEHETGLALDILCSGNASMDESQANEPGNQWLVENCYNYGFILRYPEDKEKVTGISYEPWHFRYVGVEAASKMHELGLCLEEFVEMVEKK